MYRIYEPSSFQWAGLTSAAALRRKRSNCSRYELVRDSLSGKLLEARELVSDKLLYEPLSAKALSWAPELAGEGSLPVSPAKKVFPCGIS